MTLGDPIPALHRPPYKRIDLNPLRTPTPATACELLAEGATRDRKLAQANRIWATIMQTALGTNAPAVKRQDVDTTGWDAA